MLDPDPELEEEGEEDTTTSFEVAISHIFTLLHGIFHTFFHSFFTHSMHLVNAIG